MAVVPASFPGVHPVHVSRLSAWVRPYPAGYGFPLPFGCWPSLLGPSLAHWGVARYLRVAYWRDCARQTPLGLPCSALPRCDWGGHSLYSGAVVSTHEPRVLLMPLPQGVSLGA